MVDLRLRYDIIVLLSILKQHFQKKWKIFQKPIDKQLKIGYNKYINWFDSSFGEN